MIRSFYNHETNEATARISGTHMVVKAELKALRNVITNDPDLFKLWIELIDEQIEELSAEKEKEKELKEE